MYGFEAQIAANKTKTVVLMLVFTAILALLGYAAGEVVRPEFADLLLAGCVVFAVCGSGVSYWFSDRIICGMVGARPANPNIYIERYFSDTVEGLVLACGLPAVPKPYVIETPALNAFATGRDPQHSIICVTTGLLAALDREELEGVIAHEMSHVYNRDILLMGVATVLVGGIAIFSHSIMRILWWGGGGGGRSSRSNNNGGGDSGAFGAVMLIVGLVFVILAPIFANLLNLAISRKREFLADATAVQLTRNPQGLIHALQKIEASPAKMPQVESELSALFIDPPQKKYAPRGNWLAEAFSTHPPIEERIAALEKM
jgi:heat shock protein HtpX